VANNVLKTFIPLLFTKKRKNTALKKIILVISIKLGLYRVRANIRLGPV